MIHTIRDLKEIQLYLRDDSKETLLVFDLDETLMRFSGYEGTEEWYDEKIETYLRQGSSRWHAIEKANKEWEDLQDSLQPVPIQPDVVEVLFRLHHQQKVHMVVITARTKELSQVTFRQMESIGLGFNRKNIMFTGPHSGKGPTLESYLVSLPIRPCHCICVDDRKHQIDSYFTTFQALQPSLPGTLLLKE